MKITLTYTFIACAVLAGCSDDADVASRNLSKAIVAEIERLDRATDK